jgi:hypothetical protein
VPTFTITGPNGKKYRVSGDSPEGAVAALKKMLGGMTTPADAPVAAPGKVDQEMTGGEIAADVGKSLGVGVAKGGIGLAGAIGDAQGLTGSLAGWAADKFGASPETIATVKDVASRYSVPLPGAFGAKLPGSGQIQGAIEGVTGEFYQPKSTAGEYAETIGEFAPSALAGPGGAVRRTAMAIVPAVASETAGQLTDDNPYARLLGALAGGVFVAGRSGGPMRALRNEAPSHPKVTALKDKLYDRLDKAGVKYDAIEFEKMADDVNAAIRSYRPRKAPLAHDTADYINSHRGKSPTFDDLDEFMQDAKSILREKSATNADKAAAARILDELSKFEGGGSALITNGTVSPGQVHAMAEQAREMARRNILANRIKEMARKSEGYVSGDESGMRNQFATYVQSEGKGLTAAERAAFKKVIRREGLLNMLSTEGSRLKQVAAPSAGGLIGALLGGPAGAIVGGAASYAGNLGARKIMEGVTRKQVDEALKTVLAGRAAQGKAMSAVQKARQEAIIRALLATQGARTDFQLTEPVGVPAHP